MATVEQRLSALEDALKLLQPKQSVITNNEVGEWVSNNLERLIELRHERGETQASLAEKIGVSNSSVAMWERGSRSPSPKHLAKWLAVLKAPSMTLVHYGLKRIEKQREELDRLESLLIEARNNPNHLTELFGG